MKFSSGSNEAKELRFTWDPSVPKESALRPQKEPAAEISLEEYFSFLENFHPSPEELRRVTAFREIFSLREEQNDICR